LRETLISIILGLYFSKACENVFKTLSMKRSLVLTQSTNISSCNSFRLV